MCQNVGKIDCPSRPISRLGAGFALNLSKGALPVNLASGSSPRSTPSSSKFLNPLLVYSSRGKLPHLLLIRLRLLSQKRIRHTPDFRRTRPDARTGAKKEDVSRETRTYMVTPKFLPLPSQPKLVLIYRPRRDEGWIGLGWLIGYIPK